ncbi:MAG: hypothetical protein KAR39_12790 [Thermoplasmata archaeon]|nr:hypothetical protein [Thermoplasmata archaeon]
MTLRFGVQARWPVSWKRDGEDHYIIEYDVTGKEVKTKGQVVGLVQFMLKEIVPYQISVTDTKQMVDFERWIFGELQPPILRRKLVAKKLDDFIGVE